MPSDFPAAFAALRDVLKRHSAGLTVLADTPTDYTLITPATGPNKKPLWFGAVLLKKSAVTFHLMPLYYNRTLEATIPPELLARKQGKTCFNFQRPDAAMFAHLDSLTRQARERWESAGFLNPGPITQDQLNASLLAGGENPDAIAKARRAKGKGAAAKRAASLAKKAKSRPKPKARRRARA
jgi:hypothetical protein